MLKATAVEGNRHGKVANPTRRDLVDEVPGHGMDKRRTVMKIAIREVDCQRLAAHMKAYVMKAVVVPWENWSGSVRTPRG